MQKKISVYLFLIIFILTGCTHKMENDMPEIMSDENGDLDAGESEEDRDTMGGQMSDKDRLLKFAKSFAEKKGYRVSIGSTGSTTSFKMVLEFQAPSTMRTITTLPDGVVESIYVYNADRKESTSYISQSGGSWIKQIYPGTDLSYFDLSDKYGFNASTFEMDLDKNNFTYKGTEVCGNFTCHVYEFSEEDVVSKIYFDDQEFLLRRLISQSKGEVVEMKYEYGSIYIKIPTVNIKEIPIVQSGDFDSGDMEKMKELYGL